MPLVRSVDIIQDGFSVVRSGGRTAIELDRRNIPGNIRNRDPQTVEDYINNWLDSQMSSVVNDPTDPDNGKTMWDMHIRVKVFSTNPLNVKVICSNESPEANWWR
jgi:hypothetical protein